ncbi:MAG: hypothetical protein ABH862_06770 [Candidatus Omnitrophota bacterium]
MRGAIYHTRKVRLLVLFLSLSVVWSFSSHQTHFIKDLAERKISEFLGKELTVSIGSLTGGILGDMALKDVKFSPKEGGKTFTVERVEISYKMWERREDPFKYITVYFGEDNPFLRGFIKLQKYPGKMEIFGYISPLFFGKEKEGLIGSLTRREDSKYDCDMIFGGTRRISGTIDIQGHNVELNIAPIDKKKGAMKLKASIGKKGEVKIYYRLDQVLIGTSEVIGDIWFTYGSSGEQGFSLIGENILVNKNSLLDIKAQGKLLYEEKKFILEELKWGENISLRGSLETNPPYETDMKFSVNGLELGEMEKMFTNTTGSLAGKLKGEIEIKGPLYEADIKGRVYVGEGTLGSMDFRSLFATLKGKLPIVKIDDSRVIKDWGHIIVNGEMDFSKMSEGKAFDGLIFETDNRVAVWETWQISKEEDFNIVEASKDRFTVTTSTEKEGTTVEDYSTDRMQKELGFKYKLDETSSIKMEIDEETDFFGVEHKIQF